MTASQTRTMIAIMPDMPGIISMLTSCRLTDYAVGAQRGHARCHRLRDRREDLPRDPGAEAAIGAPRHPARGLDPDPRAPARGPARRPRPSAATPRGHPTRTASR